MLRKFSLICLSCFAVAAHALSSPWFTGPLLAPAGQTIPKGHFNIEPYFMYTDAYGVYNQNWKIIKVPDTKTFNTMPVISYGLTDFMDIQAITPILYNSKEGQTAVGMADMVVILGFQAYKQRPGHWLPSLRVTVGESFPMGRYENLNPAKNGVDAFGTGSYQTSIGLNFQQVTQPFNDHYLRTRFAFTTTIPSNVSVKGFNAYGGAQNTNASINPGLQMQADLAFEYQLTQNWVPVFEVLYVDRKSSSFSGNPGTTSGMRAPLGHGEIEQLSFAPAIEYNVNDHLGIIGGVWFSVTGRDSNSFVTGALAINYYV